MIEMRKTGLRRTVGVLIALVALGIAALVFREKRGADPAPPAAAEVAATPLALPRDTSQSTPDSARPRVPMSAQQLAERARLARNATPRDALADRHNDGRSPCAELMGVWHLAGGEQLSLEAAGNATWKQSAAREPEPVHWICMQDGRAELLKAEGTLRLTREATSDVLSATDARGVRVDARRATTAGAP